MKTKIVYISGGDIFSADDIRAAFDEIRGALNLDSSTVLFGVPVDSDDRENARDINTQTLDTIPDAAPIMEPDTISLKPKKSRAKKTVNIEKINISENMSLAHAPASEINSMDVEIETLIENSADAKPSIESIPDIDTSDNLDKQPIPILSILSGNKPDVVPEIQLVSIATDNELTEEITITETIISEISDDIIDDMPQARDTLEQLLEKMTPLRADSPGAVDNSYTDETDDSAADIYDSEFDTTLSILASEFATKHDKIIQNSGTTTGKIGKLKNILPFKKSKREESSLMGDLFGWAGIAANDDDFSMPGFLGTSGLKN